MSAPSPPDNRKPPDDNRLFAMVVSRRVVRKLRRGRQYSEMAGRTRSKAMNNVIEIGGEKAVIAFEPEIQMLRGASRFSRTHFGSNMRIC
jgi:hypothetical protein